MHPRLAATAASQGGAFSARDAFRCGYSRADLRARLASGVWVAPYRGAYVDGAVWGAADDRERHRLRLAARLLLCGESTLAGHWSAAVAHDLPMLGKPPRVPVLTREGAPSTSRWVKVAQLPAAERVVIAGLRATAPDRTVVDVARRATFRAAVVTADGALRAGLTPEGLQATAERWSAWPYGTRPVRVAAFADGRAESPLESIGRVALHEQGVAPPELQVEVWRGGRFVARVDHLWERYLLIAEADGLSKYDSPGALRAEKLRQEELEQLGFAIVRYGWDEAYRQQAALAARVRDAMARAPSRRLVPGVRLVRTTLRSAAA